MEGTSRFTHCHRDLFWLGLGWQHQHLRCCSSLVISCICICRRWLTTSVLGGGRVVYSTLTPEEHTVLNHFDAHHSCDLKGRFMAPLPKKPASMELGESRAQAVRRFPSFERMMHSKGQFEEAEKVVNEFQNNHAEPVPQANLMKPPNEVFYLHIHVVQKELSTTTDCAVFDASAKTSTSISLYDTLLVGPMVHHNWLMPLFVFFHLIALL